MWPLLQHAVVRGTVAGKFFMAAYLLGPEQIGVVGVALLILALVEGVSDTGLAQALIQSKARPTFDELGAIWTLQAFRGVLISAVICMGAAPLASAFDIAQSVGLIYVAGTLPLVRGLFGPGATLSQRSREFQRIFAFESLATVADLLVTLVAIKAVKLGGISLLLGSVTGDIVRLTLSWTWLRVRIRPTLRWSLIERFASFGKWIWGSSLLTLLLNNFDKVLVAKLLGPTEFGVYSLGVRAAQSLIAEPAFAFGQYLFPTVSRLYSEAQDKASNYFAFMLPRIALAAGLLAMSLASVGPVLLSHFMGSAWASAGDVVRIASVTMFEAAVISAMAAYFRATGSPQKVTTAVLLQLVALASVAPLVISSLGAVGAATATAISHAATLLYLSAKLRRDLRMARA